MKLSDATIFLEAERFRLTPLARGIWDVRSTLLGDLPPNINVLRIPRAFHTHALIVPLRHAAPRVEASFLPDVLHTILDSEKN
ncbi:hypothetical protein A3H90_02195 [Candidatus Peribacteria bacterium RIFCSPLOWO2_02_FULL_55_36]|nr:MAG: hypothetical protein A3H90_02195 [Candidatus Peribacteria bacterium RIFCSPLOWO2_02_FULL_55_36]